MAKKILGVHVGHLSDVPELQDLLARFVTKSSGRGNVVMVRLSDEALRSIDELVEANIFTSRSEATAFLIGAGIESQKHLFDRLRAHTEEIRKLKTQLRELALDALQPKQAKKK